MCATVDDKWAPMYLEAIPRSAEGCHIGFAQMPLKERTLDAFGGAKGGVVAHERTALARRRDEPKTSVAPADDDVPLEAG